MEAPPVPTTAQGTSGVPGGIGLPGGGLNPVIDSILSSIHAPGPPAPQVKVTPVADAPKRIKVGGLAEAPKPIRAPKPLYPPLARQARISGVVRLEAIIATDGRVQNVRLVHGHPFLARGAIAAVREWLYTPQLLNGEPVEVIMQIDVNFALSQ
jgi:protein TonB